MQKGRRRSCFAQVCVAVTVTEKHQTVEMYHCEQDYLELYGYIYF